MTKNVYTYTTRIKEPQTVAGVKLDPKGGSLSEQEYRAVKKDVYGASLLEKGLLVIEKAPDAELTSAAAPAVSPASGGAGETVPDFDGSEEER